MLREGATLTPSLYMKSDRIMLGVKLQFDTKVEKVYDISVLSLKRFANVSIFLSVSLSRF